MLISADVHFVTERVHEHWCSAHCFYYLLCIWCMLVSTGVTRCERSNLWIIRYALYWYFNMLQQPCIISVRIVDLAQALWPCCYSIVVYLCVVKLDIYLILTRHYCCYMLLYSIIQVRYGLICYWTGLFLRSEHQCYVHYLYLQVNSHKRILAHVMNQYAVTVLKCWWWWWSDNLQFIDAANVDSVLLRYCVHSVCI
jgi:hypothetical protein